MLNINYNSLDDLPKDKNEKRSNKRQKHNHHYTESRPFQEHEPSSKESTLSTNNLKSYEPENYDSLLLKKSKYKSIIKKRDFLINDLKTENERLKELIHGNNNNNNMGQTEDLKIQSPKETIESMKLQEVQSRELFNNIEHQRELNEKNLEIEALKKSLFETSKSYEERIHDLEEELRMKDQDNQVKDMEIQLQIKELIKVENDIKMIQKNHTNEMNRIVQRYNFIKSKNVELNSKIINIEEKLLNSENKKSIEILTNHIEKIEKDRFFLKNSNKNLLNKNFHLEKTCSKFQKLFLVLTYHINYLQAKFTGSSESKSLQQSIINLTNNDTELERSKSQILELVTKLNFKSKNIRLLNQEIINLKLRQLQIWDLYNQMKLQRDENLDRLNRHDSKNLAKLEIYSRKIQLLRNKIKRTKVKGLYEKCKLQTIINGFNDQIQHQNMKEILPNKLNIKDDDIFKFLNKTPSSLFSNLSSVDNKNLILISLLKELYIQSLEISKLQKKNLIINNQLDNEIKLKVEPNF